MMELKPKKLAAADDGYRQKNEGDHPLLPFVEFVGGWKFEAHTKITNAKSAWFHSRFI